MPPLLLLPISPLPLALPLLFGCLKPCCTVLPRRLLWFPSPGGCDRYRRYRRRSLVLLLLRVRLRCTESPSLEATALL